MATVAFRSGLNMFRMLARLDDTIMAGGAASKRLLSMYEIDHQPGLGRSMTKLTGCTGAQVADILPGSADTIVTGCTIVTDSGMGEILYLPIVRGMAEITGFSSKDVGCRLAGGADTVVAGFTSPADNIGVVEIDQ